MSPENIKNFVLNILLDCCKWIFTTAIVIGIAAPLLTMMAIYQDIIDFTWFWRVFDYFFPNNEGIYGINEIMWFYLIMTIIVGLVGGAIKILWPGMRKVGWRMKFRLLTGSICLIYIGLAVSSYIRLDIDAEVYIAYLLLFLGTLLPAVLLMGLIWFIEQLKKILVIRQK